MDYTFIESAEQLKDSCDLFLEKKIIGVDLEADSLHCFKEKICLIQIATADQAFLIDPFVLKEIDPFLKVLEDKEVIKIFHGADFDIRSLDRDYQVRVRNLFDTEIACRFLGVKERGLGALLKAYFDVYADKRFQKVDWSQRPLKPDMIEYSVKDVAYLTRLYGIIKKQLEENGRFSWAKEEFEIQEAVRYENNHKAPLFQKFKGAGKMDNRSLAVLENLLQLRIEIARQKDRPLFKIMSNASLLTMAQQKPETIDKVLKIKALSRKQSDMYGKGCVNAVMDAMALDHGNLPCYPKTRRMKRDVNVQHRIKRLKKMREKVSGSTGIEPGFLLNNTVIGAIAGNNPETLRDLLNIEQVRQWQANVLGQKILSTL